MCQKLGLDLSTFEFYVLSCIQAVRVCRVQTILLQACCLCCEVGSYTCVCVCVCVCVVW
jgi:hypothetical protein